MPKFVIEREFPGAGSVSAADLQAFSQKSCEGPKEFNPRNEWGKRFLTGDRIDRMKIFPSQKAIREDAGRSGCSANRSSQSRILIDSSRAEY